MTVAEILHLLPLPFGAETALITGVAHGFSTAGSARSLRQHAAQESVHVNRLLLVLPRSVYKSKPPALKIHFSGPTHLTNMHCLRNPHLVRQCSWTRGISTFDEILLISNQLPKELALEIIVMSCWGIWSVRNDKIFRSESPAIDSWKFHLSEELWAVQLRAKEGKANRIKEWTDFNL